MPITKKAETIPGKWGLQQKIKHVEKRIEKLEEEEVSVFNIIKKKGLKTEKKDLKELKRQLSFKKPEYPLGKKWEKRHDIGWSKYEKGEHYNTPTNNSNKKYTSNYKKKLKYT